MDICIYDLILKINACKEVYWRPHEYQAHKSRVPVVFGVNYSSECSDPFMKHLLVIQIGKLYFHNLFILENIMKYLQIIERSRERERATKILDFNVAATPSFSQKRITFQTGLLSFSCSFF